MTEQADFEGAEASEGPEPANPAAVSIALDQRSSPGAPAVDVEAAAFLRDQRHLINLQAEHLHEQRELQLAHLRVRRWKDRMSLSLQLDKARALSLSVSDRAQLEDLLRQVSPGSRM